MPEGDGGHIWPFRDQDPRYKSLVPTKAKDLQTDTKEALIADLGLSGKGYSLDDLWARKKTDADAEDTSEPFEEDIFGPSSDWGPPDNLSDSFIIYTTPELTSSTGIVNNPTTKRINDFYVSDDGLQVLVANNSTDVVYSYTLSAPHEYDTVIANTGADGQTNPAMVQWSGSNWSVRRSIGGGVVDVMTGSGKHDVGGSDASASQFSFTDNGFFTGNSGQYAFNADGSRFYATGEMLTQSFLKTWPITSYNLDTISDVADSNDSELNIEAVIGNVGVSNMQVSNDGLKIYFFTGSNLHLFTMTIAGDLSTGSWTVGTVNIASTLFSTSGLGGFHVHSDAQQISFCKDTTASPVIYVADMNFVAP